MVGNSPLKYLLNLQWDLFGACLQGGRVILSALAHNRKQNSLRQMQLARISQFPCMETPTRLHKWFLSPHPLLNVVWKD